jgi:hypothetical protein
MLRVYDNIDLRFVENLKQLVSNSGIKRVDVFSYLKTKSNNDEIDKMLAKHYGFTEEELDFIINYDIKYRMGDELTQDEE